ncbi:MAG: EAL domain-containing protein [Burkholderiaceae bacterium]|nr:EAL domain-containing protein [Burkholderiaceae bacterium]
MRSFFLRNLIHVSVAMAALMALGVGLVLIAQALHSDTALERLRDAHEAAAELLRATALQARERGLVAASMGSRHGLDDMDELVRLRDESEASWQRAMALVERIVADSESPLIDAYTERAKSAHERLQAARAQAYRGIGTGTTDASVQEWLGAATANNLACAGLRDQLLGAVEMPAGVIRLHLSLARTAWVLSEHAGQIRGILAAHAGRSEPLGESFLEQIGVARATIRQTLDELPALAALPGLAPHLRAAMLGVEETLGRRFDAAVQAMLQAASTGDYPYDAANWYETTTAQIDTIAAFSEAAAKFTTAQLETLAERRLLTAAAFLAFTLCAGYLASLSLRAVKRNADALFLQKELAEVTLHSIGDAVITTDAQGRVKYLNPVAEELTGWTSLEARGRPGNEIFRIENTLHASVVDPIGVCLREGQVVGLASGHVLQRRDGRRIAIEDSAAPIRSRDASIVGCVVVFYDAESPRNNDHLLSYHATRDALTGLINRREFDRRLQELVHHAKAREGHHVLAYIDLDQFKVVNDTCGHTAGDRMLRQITFLLRKKIREGDVLARLGGDEFAVLLHNCPLEKGVAILDELRNSLSAFRFTWENKAFAISMSIGVVPITPSSINAAELLSEADAACYAAKEKGRNRVQVYQPDDMELFQRKGEMQWVARITEALQEDRLVLYCQRMLPLKPGVAERIEILVRLLSPDGAVVPPMAFIPAAERYNLMPGIDRWVIRNACARLSDFLAGNEEMMVNINLSGLSLGEKDIARFVSETAAAAGIAPHRLCFEVTETAAIASMEAAFGVMQQISDQGFTFSLDDFGTGLSSFSYLKTLPVRQIKIGDNYVRNLLSDPLSHAIVRSVVEIGSVLGIELCAECVEDRETLSVVSRMGVEYAQGFAVAPPIPLDDYLYERQGELFPTA